MTEPVDTSVRLSSAVETGDELPKIRRNEGDGPPPAVLEPPYYRGRGGSWDAVPLQTPVGNDRLAMLFFLGAEAMLFAGLISAFLVFRFGAGMWPPMGQPRLPIGVTLINTIVLLASAFTMRRAVRAISSEDQAKFLRNLSLTALLGGTFLVVQGSEWARLLEYGLTMSAGVYGSTFYTLIGMHAFHVFAAVVWLIVVFVRGTMGVYSAPWHRGVTLCSMYWYFVVAVWPILFLLVYPSSNAG